MTTASITHQAIKTGATDIKKLHGPVDEHQEAHMLELWWPDLLILLRPFSGADVTHSTPNICAVFIKQAVFTTCTSLLIQ